MLVSTVGIPGIQLWQADKGQTNTLAGPVLQSFILKSVGHLPQQIVLFEADITHTHPHTYTHSLVNTLG